MGDLTKRVALELLHKVSNPNVTFFDMDPDEDGVSPKAKRKNVNVTIMIVYTTCIKCM